MSKRLDGTQDDSYEAARDYLIDAEREYWDDVVEKERDPTDEEVIMGAPLYRAWNVPEDNPGGSLFIHVTRSGRAAPTYGCLTQIRADTYYGVQDLSDDFKSEIRFDKRLPKGIRQCTTDYLDRFVY